MCYFSLLMCKFRIAERRWFKQVNLYQYAQKHLYNTGVSWYNAKKNRIMRRLKIQPG